tara:strand:- start:136 stop:1545 length:1410 start_codon:yes stop_codon:yes gene_type:complete
MENVINNEIGVSFFLKKMSHKNSVKKRGVYTTISYAGTSAKMKTGLVCLDPETQWKRGMFEGKNFSNENKELLEIKHKIESFDTRFCKSAKHIRDLYNGADADDIPMTILMVFEESLEKKRTGKKAGVKSSTLMCHKSAVSTYKKWMKKTQRPEFGVVDSHPYKITTRLMEKFYEWDLERGVSEATANNHIHNLHHLYEIFHKINNGDVEGLIPNPFKGIVEREEEQERTKKALERCVDWSWIEKIENLRSITPEGVVVGKVDLFDEEWLFKGQRDLEKKLVKREKMRLLTLIIAYTGLSFVEVGKADVLSITRTMNGGKVLSGQRVKTKQVYTIPVTPKLEGLINKLGPLPWQPFVDENLIVDYKKKETTYHVLYKYLKEVLMDQIGWDEDYDLTPHWLRHTFAMRQLNHFGFSLMVVARMMGDDEKTVRKNYANHDDDAISKAFNAEMERFNKRQQEDDNSKTEVAT